MTKKDDFHPVQLEIQAVTEEYIFPVPYSDHLIEDEKHIRQVAEELLKQKLGDDEIEIGKVVLQKPGRVKRRLAKTFKRTPQARLRITTRF